MNKLLGTKRILPMLTFQYSAVPVTKCVRRTNEMADTFAILPLTRMTLPFLAPAAGMTVMRTLELGEVRSPTVGERMSLFTSTVGTTVRQRVLFRIVTVEARPF